MDKKAMLGKLVEFVRWFNELTSSALQHICGPLIDFLTKLCGADGEEWLDKFGKFLRGELVEPQAAELPLARTAAEKRRNFFQNWFKKLDIKVEVSLPTINGRLVSGKEIRNRRKKGQNLFFWPGNGRGRYNELMAAMNQVNHWTVASGTIAWDPQAQRPFWFWAEDQLDCPRLKTPWNDLMKKFPADATQHLLSLEEYMLVFFAYREKNNKFFDKATWSWLRTRFGSAHALRAYCNESRLSVGWDGNLDYSDGNVGGRLAEILV